MIIAEQKRKENVAEYLLYMYQVEDIIRASGFDLQRIEKEIIDQFEVAYDTKREMYEWYKGLADRLVSENKQKTGHMDFLKKITADLDKLNIELLHGPLNKEYKDTYNKAREYLDALRMRAGHTSENDIQLALNSLYGLLILKLQKKEISRETQEAFAYISEWVAFLSSEFIKNESL